MFSHILFFVISGNAINIILVVFAYLVGSIPVGVILGKMKGVDPRKTGSGNIGATNVMRAGGKKLGIITLIGDVAKGFIPVIAATALGLDTSVIAIVGFAAFIGHVLPVFLRFKGGKGVATALGVYIAICPLVIVGAMIVFVIVFAIWRYVSLASLVGAVVVPVGLYIFKKPHEFVVMAGLIGVIVIIRHKENISRIIKGTENKLSFKKI